MLNIGGIIISPSYCSIKLLNVYQFYNEKEANSIEINGIKSLNFGFLTLFLNSSDDGVNLVDL